MKEPVLETCELNHKFYKETGSDTECPICLKIELTECKGLGIKEEIPTPIKINPIAEALAKGIKK